MGTEKLEARLKEIRGGARKQAPTVRVLAAFAGNAGCGLAALGFAARADFDHLLAGTSYQAEFGQSRFAFQRGNLFENLIRKDDYAVARELLRAELGLDPTRTRVANLRSPTRAAEQMTARAGTTREVIRAVVERRADAPNLIDGAVFETDIRGLAARSLDAKRVAAVKNAAQPAGTGPDG